ncbi:hypothetical protein GHT06_011360 [Daphnia sinensis]|uniref:Uncharacterized protein n=1 Tax=Daphnia sinensis TaxID=1820382 RepID=A0AAD5L0J7_9CRUS|nr:hypothetical protein GHT06_011360 [Daphnia sinensis]
MVRKIDIYRKRMANFLDASHPVTCSTFRKAINARNDICHLKYQSLCENWYLYTSAWRTLCRSIGNPDPAIKVQVVYNFLLRRDYRGAIDNQTFLVTSPDFDDDAAYGLSCTLFGCLTRYVAPALRNFLINDKGHPTSTALDAYYNLKHMISEQKFNSNYLSKDDNDISVLQISMQAWIQLVDTINGQTTSAEMQGILKTLVSALNENLEVHLADCLHWLTNPVIPDNETDTV